MTEHSSIIPVMRYRDAPAAIEWLCEVLGFEKQLVVPGPPAPGSNGGAIAHAQLRLGGGMVMIGSAVDSEYGRLMKQPEAVSGAETQSPYIVVPDADAVYAKVKAAGESGGAGWRILIDIKDEDYGGRGFTCADPEGHIWSVGSYDPWDAEE